MINRSTLPKNRIFYEIFFVIFVFIITGIVLFLKNWVFAPQNIIQSEGKTNILVLGTGGEGHQGKDLSDTIIIASINHDQKRASLISLPRDLWVPTLQAKLNAAYEKGLEKEGGLSFAKKTVADLSGVPIHYALRIDFFGFSKLIDILGGIDLEVEKTFDDFKYPLNGKEQDSCGYQITAEASDSAKVTIFRDATGASVPEELATSCRYEQVHFDRRAAHMDGNKALKFVRSRMGTNNENTDFARSKRQQRVILAAKNKFFSFSTLSNPAKITQLTTILGKSIETDIPPSLYPRFLKLAKEIADTQIKTKVIDQKDEVLYNPPLSEYLGQWVLVPKGKDYNFLRDKIRSLLDEN